MVAAFALGAEGVQMGTRMVSAAEALVDATHNVFGDFGDAQALYFGGDMNAAIALSGQVAGRIDAVRPVADIIADTVREFGDVVARLQGS